MVLYATHGTQQKQYLLTASFYRVVRPVTAVPTSLPLLYTRADLECNTAGFYKLNKSNHLGDETHVQSARNPITRLSVCVTSRGGGGGGHVML